MPEYRPKAEAEPFCSGDEGMVPEGDREITGVPGSICFERHWGGTEM